MVKTKYMAYGHPWEPKFRQWYIQLISIVLISNYGVWLISNFIPYGVCFIQFYPFEIDGKDTPRWAIDKSPSWIGHIPMKARFLMLKFQEVPTIMRYRQTLAAWLPSNWEYGDSKLGTTPSPLDRQFFFRGNS